MYLMYFHFYNGIPGSHGDRTGRLDLAIAERFDSIRL